MDLEHYEDDAVLQTITNDNSDKIEINLTYSPRKIAIDSLKTKSALKKAIYGLKFLKDPSDGKNKILDFEIIAQ